MVIEVMANVNVPFWHSELEVQRARGNWGEERNHLPYPLVSIVWGEMLGKFALCTMNKSAVCCICEKTGAGVEHFRFTGSLCPCLTDSASQPGQRVLGVHAMRSWVVGRQCRASSHHCKRFLTGSPSEARTLHSLLKPCKTVHACVHTCEQNYKSY